MASRICSSLTAATRPLEELKAFIASSQRAGLPIRIAGSDRLRVGDRGAVNQRSRAGGLEAVTDRCGSPFLKALPVGGHVAGVADRIASASGARQARR